MRRLFTVFQFELMSYIKNKSFMISTIVLAVLLGVATFLPRVIDMSDFLGIENVNEEERKDGQGETGDGPEGSADEEEKSGLGIVDANGYFQKEMLEEVFSGTEFRFMDSVDEMKNAIETGELEAGFHVMDDLHYEYYVLNKNISDDKRYVFDSLMTMVHKQTYCEENGLDYAVFMEEYEAVVSCDEKILGKDGRQNYWYCYALVIVVFVMIITYGVMIATSVTTEKSNRAVEVLVTSIDPAYLLFGKVFAGAVAAVVQLGLVMGSVLLGYSVNHSYWGDTLDLVLDIPAPVLVGFAVFGIGGFLFYAFLYGAMGALVSKTEDINKTSGTVQMIIMLVYFVVMFQLGNPDGIIMRICSFLPISSYTAMFVRIGMGSVAFWELAVSAALLYVSIFFSGWLASKIYRMGTLRYGNPISITRAFKDMKNAE